ncbi:MAG: RNA polymerase sporulation sigma factor SigK [Eubacteriales bacterium]|nr:RNA polymerase sporulation sigma factor SigK [Eubacteriales bacterium]
MLDALLSLLRNVFFLTGRMQLGSSFPEPLTPDEEKRAIERMAEGDADARCSLIEHNLRLVAHIAKKYTTARREADDLISIGTVGLIKAVATFKSGKGNTLATYASKCIENEILMYLRTEKKQAGEVSISDPIGVDRDGNEIALADVLGSDAEQTHNIAEMSIVAGQLRTLVENRLNGREQIVIQLRYGLKGGCPMPQREVAQILGISRSYVSRIEKKALAKLRNGMGDVNAYF